MLVNFMPNRSPVLAEANGISQPNVSKHLAVMRAAGLVEAVRDGRGSVYRLTDEGVIGACDVMADVMRRRLARLAELSAAIEKPEPATT